MSLTDYLEAFRALNVNRAAGHASPHKVCMLLAVMDLIEQGAITANQIPYEDALTEKFKQHMDMLGSDADRVNAYLPYYH
jgi:putative restriction endonuclease